MSEEKYYCFSCDGEMDADLVEKAKRTGKYQGVCHWCKDLARSMNKTIDKKVTK